MNFSSRKMQIVATFIAIVAASSVANGQKFRMPFKKQQSDQTANRVLEDKNGPWLIMCTSFTGDNAEEKARLLCRELQQKEFKTYIYRQSFDYSKPMVGVGWQTPKTMTQLVQDGEIREVDVRLGDDNPEPEPLRMKSANLSKTSEVAVLVGDFSAADDHRAQKTLKKIKNMPVRCMGSNDSKPTKIGNIERSQGGPLKTAILVPNPLLPDEYFQQKRVDSFIMKLNRQGNIKYSLLDCPGIYSVKIASFRGEATIDPNKIQKGTTQLQSYQEKGKSLLSGQLLEGEEKAHNLTQALRARGVEAYEFHDRQESYVCIGSFDWVTRKSGNGDTVMNNPAIVRVVNKCKPETKNLPGAPNAIIPKSIGGIPLDPDPVPIVVPKTDRSMRTGARLNFLKKR